MSIPVIDTLNPLGDFPVVNASDVQAGDKKLNDVLSEKVDKTYVDTQLSTKASLSDLSQISNTKADKTYVDTQLSSKSNVSDLISKADVSTVTDLSNKVSEVETEQSTINARMDTFTTLTEGSTTGDAELADAHIGIDGKSYTNVGNAIRGQVSDLKSDISFVNVNINDLSNTGKISKNFSSMAVDKDNAFINFPSGSYTNSGDHKVVSLSLKNVKKISYTLNNTVSLPIGGVKTNGTVVETFYIGNSGTCAVYEFDETYNGSTVYFNWFNKDSTYLDKIIVEYRNVKPFSEMKVEGDGFINYDGSYTHSYEHETVIMSMKNVNSITYTPKTTVSLPFGVIKNSSGTVMKVLDSSTANVTATYDFDETFNDCIAIFNWFGKSGAYLDSVLVDYRNVEYNSKKSTHEMFNAFVTVKLFSELEIDRGGFVNSDGSYTDSAQHQTRKLDLRNVDYIEFGSGNSSNAIYGVIKDKKTNAINYVLSTNISGLTLKIDEEWHDSVMILNFFNYASGSGSEYVHDAKISYYGELAYDVKNVINGDYIKNIYADSIAYNNCVKKPFAFSGKTAVFTGDSITYGFTSGTSDVHNTGDYPKLFSAKVGMTYANYAQGGACFCSGKNEVVTIPTQVQNNSNKNCDFLFIAGGVNDWQIGATLSEFKTTIANLCTYINSNYSQSTQVIWITPINEAGWNTMSIPTAKLQDFRNEITRTVMKNDTYARFSVVQGNSFNFPVKDDDSEYISSMFGDKLHPSALGYKTLYLGGLCSALC